MGPDESFGDCQCDCEDLQDFHATEITAVVPMGQDGHLPQTVMTMPSADCVFAIAAMRLMWLLRAGLYRWNEAKGAGCPCKQRIGPSHSTSVQFAQDQQANFWLLKSPEAVSNADAPCQVNRLVRGLNASTAMNTEGVCRVTDSRHEVSGHGSESG